MFLEESRGKERVLIASYFKMVSSVVYSLTLKMKAISSSATVVTFQRTTRQYILRGVNKNPVDSLLMNAKCEC
jgi:hypothetical protein